VSLWIDVGNRQGASKQTKEMEQYTESIKARMIKRMTGPNALSANALAKEVGISQNTLSRWLRTAGTVTPVNSGKGKKVRSSKKAGRRSQDWTMQDKLRIVLEAEALSDAELGMRLRREGLHSEQLDQWREAAAAALGKPAARKRGKPGPTPEQKRIKDLERQLRHKEKALAEAAALLVLKKKFETLFGDEDNDTEPGSEG
jgi:transposase-like protein